MPIPAVQKLIYRNFIQKPSVSRALDIKDINSARFTLLGSDRTEKERIILNKIKEIQASGSEPADKMRLISDTIGLNIELYNKLIPELLESCLDNIRILENHQLQLRGDCLPDSELDDLHNKDLLFTSCVRNKIGYSIETSAEKHLALFFLTAEIYNRITCALRLQDRHNINIFLPVILIGFKQAEDMGEALRSIPSSFYRADFFDGDCDDSGVPMRHLFFIKLKDGHAYFNFPQGLAFSNISKYEHQMLSAIATFDIYAGMQYQLVWRDPKVLFNTLLLADHILSVISKRI